MGSPKVFFVNPHPQILSVLQNSGYDVTWVRNEDEAAECISRQDDLERNVALVVYGVDKSLQPLLALLRFLEKEQIHIPILVVCEDSVPKHLQALLTGGFMRTPCTICKPQELISQIARLTGWQDESDQTIAPGNSSLEIGTGTGITFSLS